MSLAGFTRTVGQKIGPVGGAFMLHPETMERGQELGLSPFGFYALGRGGVLGDVETDVVASAFFYFEPSTVGAVWNEAREKMEPKQGADHYAEACRTWGRKRLDGVPDLDAFCQLTDRVIEAADARGLTLFAGWRAMPLPDDAPGRAMQQLHVLRELRGGANGVATRVAGLAAKEAVAVNSPHMYRLFGWQDDQPESEPFRERVERAEDITDELVASAFAVLDEGEREVFATVVDGVELAVAGG